MGSSSTLPAFKISTPSPSCGRTGFKVFLVDFFAITVPLHREKPSQAAWVYLKSRKFSLFLQAQLDFALNSLEIHKGFLRLFALNPACACETFVIFFVFRYTLRSQLPRGGSFWGRPAKFPSCARPLPFGRGGIASAMTERVLSSRPDHPDTLRRAGRYAPCGLPDCRPARYRTPVRSAPHRWALL